MACVSDHWLNDCVRGSDVTVQLLCGMHFAIITISASQQSTILDNHMHSDLCHAFLAYFKSHGICQGILILKLGPTVNADSNDNCYYA